MKAVPPMVPSSRVRADRALPVLVLLLAATACAGVEQGVGADAGQSNGSTRLGDGAGALAREPQSLSGVSVDTASGTDATLAADASVPFDLSEWHLDATWAVGVTDWLFATQPEGKLVLETRSRPKPDVFEVVSLASLGEESTPVGKIVTVASDGSFAFDVETLELPENILGFSRVHDLHFAGIFHDEERFCGTVSGKWELSGSLISGSAMPMSGRPLSDAGFEYRCTEICNGADDDGDGQTDEREDCYEGPEGTRRVGRCQDGTQNVCGGTCEGQVLPEEEVCDAIDNDCNGVVDDAFGTGAECDADGVPGEIVCDGTAGTKCQPMEICDNGIDDDEDGRVDEECPCPESEDAGPSCSGNDSGTRCAYAVPVSSDLDCMTICGNVLRTCATSSVASAGCGLPPLQLVDCAGAPGCEANEECTAPAECVDGQCVDVAAAAEPTVLTCLCVR